MKSNETLQKDVQDAIKWEPLLKAAEIGVIAQDGVITLTGTVNSYSKKIEAESAARNVAEVKAVVEKIEINFGNSWSKNDNEIATEVTLTGTLKSLYQKTEAARITWNALDVWDVDNELVVEYDYSIVE
ncbi:MAG: BON domain-containing protein [Cytophagaceae bacterium]|nr:BON domain-containing protein [Cytophagaceae bacterium]